MNNAMQYLQQFFYVLLFNSLLATGVASASAWELVTVQNPDGIGSGTTAVVFGQRCGMVPETAVFVKHAWAGLGLYRVESTERLRTGQCPTGTLFLEVPATVERWQNLAQIYRDIDANERRKMRKFLEAK